MSYTMTVVVKDGKAEVASDNYVTPPDGKYMISGHVPTGEPGNYSAENIAITRYSSDGAQMLAQASATVLKE